MTPGITYTYVELPNGEAVTFIGAPPTREGGCLVLRAPNGRPLLRVPAAWCKPSSEAERAARITADVRAWREERIKSN